ncbi:MAG: MarR family winged helix-turn-helix transcriptional regulator [Candidatus Wenzhouxiangella sp. M2_3B_020]
MSALDLEHFLPYRLSVLSNRVSQGIARTYEQRFGLSVTEWRVIAILGRYPGASATEVAQRSAMDKVAVSRAVRRLLEAGRIEREPNDADRRERHLRLTEAGRALHDEIVPAALAYEQRIREALTEEENVVLERLIEKLVRVV